MKEVELRVSRVVSGKCRGIVVGVSVVYLSGGG